MKDAAVRTVVGHLALMLGIVILGSAVGASIGWFIGTLQLRDYPEFLAGEHVSEDLVPRVLYTWAGGFLGCVSGYVAGLLTPILFERRQGNAVKLGVDTNSDDPPVTPTIQ